MVDRLRTQPGVEQLATGDDAMLPADESPQGDLP
jgi:hypothetical protein